MIGSVGRTVIANIEAIRKQRGMSFRDLAARLTELGRPVGDTVLHRQSQGKRRIDADDLVAFAIALGVTPNSLLFERRGGREVVVELTPTTRQRLWLAWEWADGRSPLPDHLIGDDGIVRHTVADMLDFLTYARPDVTRRRDHPAVRAAEQLIGRILLAQMKREEKGADWTDADRAWWDKYIDTELKRLVLELGEMWDDPAATASLTVTPAGTATAARTAADEARAREDGGDA